MENVFVPIAMRVPISIVKSYQEGEDKRYVEGWCATTDLDLVGDVITDEAFKSSEKDLETNSTVLYNHDLNMPIGKVESSTFDKKGLYLKVLISSSKDVDAIWKKVTEGVINKFSIRLRVLDATKEFVAAVKREVNFIKKMLLLEASLVTVPANPEAKCVAFYLSKGFEMGNGTQVKELDLVNPAVEGAKADVPEIDKAIVPEDPKADVAPAIKEKTTAEIAEEEKAKIAKDEADRKTKEDADAKIKADADAKIKADEDIKNKEIADAKVKSDALAKEEADKLTVKVEIKTEAIQPEIDKVKKEVEEAMIKVEGIVTDLKFVNLDIYSVDKENLQKSISDILEVVKALQTSSDELTKSIKEDIDGLKTRLAKAEESVSETSLKGIVDKVLVDIPGFNGKRKGSGVGVDEKLTEAQAKELYDSLPLAERMKLVLKQNAAK